MPSQQAVQVQQQQVPMGPTRWCPTPEQLMILEEMYRGGLRTPNSSQIQQITAHLAAYGRIEGKNVFYWFQNHKARDRQKLRRRLCMSHHLLTCAQYYHHGFLAAPPQLTATTAMPVAPPPPYAVFDHQLLAPTSPTPAAAAAAAAYGYYYPAATAFPAAARCGGGGATTPPSPNQMSFSYHQQQAGIAGGPPAPEYSLGKLADVAALDDTNAAAVERLTPPGFELAPAAFCRPLKTLDLFPGGLKEEQHDVA